MRIRGLLVLVVVMGFALAQGEVMTPGGLPTPLASVAATAGGGVQRGVDSPQGGGQGRNLAGVA